MRILLSGGGTAGSVTPLLAVMQRLESSVEVDAVWLGTYRGPERKLVSASSIRFIPIFSGKLRRYFSLRNFVDPILIILGLLQSLYVIRHFNPDVVVSAGGFVSVPVATAAFLLRKKIIIHQLDIQRGLANRIMTPMADRVTVSFPESLDDFPEQKVVHTGTPIRAQLYAGERERGLHALGLDPALPIVLVWGGGTGSLQLNKIVISALPELLQDTQVIHITGAGKSVPPIAIKENSGRYRQFEFVVDELPNILALADVVVCRAGMATLTELAALKKAAVVVPIPQSQQEENARYFFEHKAIIYMPQHQLSAQHFVQELRELLADEEALSYLRTKINGLHVDDAVDRLGSEIVELASREK